MTYKTSDRQDESDKDFAPLVVHERIFRECFRKHGAEYVCVANQFIMLVIIGFSSLKSSLFNLKEDRMKLSCSLSTLNWNCEKSYISQFTVMWIDGCVGRERYFTITICEHDTIDYIINAHTREFILSS